MTLFIIIAFTVLLSYFLNFKKYKKINERMQQIVLYAVLFAMGVSLGADTSFFEALPSLGLNAVLFALSTGAFSVAAAYVITRKIK